MAKFRFQLEAVLKQRLAAERARQLIVAELETMRVAIEDRIRGYQRQLESERADLREELSRERDGAGAGEAWGGGVDLRAVRMQANAALHLVARAQQAVVELAGVHSRIDAARLELLKATMARKAVEKLKERRLEAWREEQSRAEAAAADEISVMHANRRDQAA
jgi:flagellar export protein FliJ